MPRIPSKSFEIGKTLSAKIESILREDAEQQIAQGDLDPSDTRLLQWLLSQEGMMTASWKPSIEARRKIACLPQKEDALIQNGLVHWLADEVRNLILESRSYEAFKLLERVDPSIIEKLEPSLRREKCVFYRAGNSWFVRFKDGSKDQDKWAVFKDEKWVRCIAFLLEHPYEKLSPRDVLAGRHLEKSEKNPLNVPPLKFQKEVEKSFRELDKDDNYDEDKWRNLIKAYEKEVRIKRTEKGELYFNWLYIPESERIGITQHIRKGKAAIKKSLPHLENHLRHLKGGYSPHYTPPPNTPRWHIHW
jgi:hypothetical protein